MVATDTKALRTEYEGLLKDMREMSEADDFDRAEFDKKRERAGEIKAEFEQIAADDDRKKSIDSMADFLEKPQYRVAHAVDADDSGRKALVEAGWEIKGGVVLAPTSKGKMVPMYSEEILFGELPKDDPEAANYMKATRAAFQPKYRETFVKFMRLASKQRSESVAFAMMSSEEQKALSEGTDTAGGFLVPPDAQAEMLTRLPDVAVMRSLARVVNTSRDVVVWPRLQAHGSSPSIYSSGFVGDWAGETPAFADTDPAFGRFEVPIKKVRCATKLSNDWIADAVSNVLAMLAENGAENMALVEDNGFITGVGDALHPKGILEAGISTVDVEGTTANTITSSATNLGTGLKIIQNLIYGVPPQYRSRGAFLMSPNSEGKTRVLTDFQGRYQFPGMGGKLSNIDGFPVKNSQFMPNDGVDARKVYVFGDFAGYIIAQRAQISVVVLRERFADTDQTGIILFERVGGDLWNEDALRVGVV